MKKARGPDDRVFAYMFFLGLGSEVILIPMSYVVELAKGPIAHQLLKSVGSAEILALLAWALGALGLAYQTFSLSKESAVADLTGRSDEMVVEYVDGMMSAGGHYHSLLWWESPPRLMLDSSRKEMPTFNAYSIWLGKLHLRLIRTPRSPSRWAKFIAVGVAQNFGVLYAWFVIHHVTEAG